jgi:hypothetical protein
MYCSLQSNYLLSTKLIRTSTVPTNELEAAAANEGVQAVGRVLDGHLRGSSPKAFNRTHTVIAWSIGTGWYMKSRGGQTGPANTVGAGSVGGRVNKGETKNPDKKSKRLQSTFAGCVTVRCRLAASPSVVQLLATPVDGTPKVWPQRTDRKLAIAQNSHPEAVAMLDA